jgi:chorismate mutase
VFNYWGESSKMHFHVMKLAAVAAFAIGQMGAAYAQNEVEQLQPLVETTAQRLMIAEQVALAKWDSGKPVEDEPREAQVILGAVKDGVAKGLDKQSVSNFFKAQIEANKIVQYALLADWYRAGKAPEHAPVDLLKDIRPQLDEIQKSLIADLANTAAVRTSKTCHVHIAEAVGKYVSTHANGHGPIDAATLDRALAGACIL